MIPKWWWQWRTGIITALTFPKMLTMTKRPTRTEEAKKAAAFNCFVRSRHKNDPSVQSNPSYRSIIMIQFDSYNCAIIRGRSHITLVIGGGGGGVSQMLTIADKGGCGSENFSTKGFYVNKNLNIEGNWFRFYHSWYSKLHKMQIGP